MWHGSRARHVVSVTARPQVPSQVGSGSQQVGHVRHHQASAHDRVRHEEDRRPQHARLHGRRPRQQAPDPKRRQEALQHRRAEGERKIRLDGLKVSIRSSHRRVVPDQHADHPAHGEEGVHPSHL